jgi:putative sterol carrier protein
MGIADLEATLATHRDALGELGARLKLDCGPEGPILVDGTTRPATLSREDGEADCTIIASTGTLLQVLAGELDAAEAMMTGMLRLEGSTTVAMQLTSLIG